MKKILFVIMLLTLSTNTYAKKEAAFCQNQLSAKPIKDGYTWTLTSRLAQALREAEKQYGERDKTWTILGVEFTADKSPQVWYPFSGEKEKFVIVQLTQKASCDDKEALYQLGHEVIHLLSPNGGKTKSNVLEEGLAVRFALQYLNQQGHKVSADYIGSKVYKEAYEAVEALYGLEGDASKSAKADKMIELLRLEHSSLSKISKRQLMQNFLKLDDELAEKLVKTF